jgi:hypothetical protein
MLCPHIIAGHRLDITYGSRLKTQKPNGLFLPRVMKSPSVRLNLLGKRHRDGQTQMNDDIISLFSLSDMERNNLSVH